MLGPRRLPARAAMAVAAGLGVLAIASGTVAVVAHVDDARDLDHVAGTWITLARDANAGTLYPPLYDGDRFGGTRFMPVPIVLQALAARVSGEYLVSAKTLSAVLVVALLALVFVLLRRGGCPTPLALLLTGTLLLSGTGLTAALSVRNDTLPVILQLAAVALVAGSTSRRVVVAAGVLCAIALASKLSAVWALAAIAIWLWRCDRRGLARFALAFGGTLTLALVVFEAASEGRMDDNVLGLALAGQGLPSLADELPRLRLIGREGLGPLVVLPLLAIVGALLAARRRTFSPFHLAFAVALLVTGVVLLDPGAFVNHLLDVHVLSVIVVGELWRQVSPRGGGLSLASAAVLSLLVVATAVTYVRDVDLADDARTLLHGTSPAERMPSLASSIPAGRSVLSEDPLVPVARDQRPVVLDPFMLRRIGAAHPEWRRDLVRRIDRHEFDAVVLLYEPASAASWYRDLHFGVEIVSAIERSYRHVGEADGYQLYVSGGSR